MEKFDAIIEKPNSFGVEINGGIYNIVSDDDINNIETLEKAYLDEVHNSLQELQKGLTEEQKDQLWISIKDKWNSYAVSLTELKYSFPLSWNDAKYLSDLLNNKLEYDSDNILFAMELGSLIKGMLSANADSNGVVSFPCTNADSNYLYLTIKGRKERGLKNKNTFSLAEILRRIAHMNRITKYFESNGERNYKMMTEFAKECEAHVIAVPTAVETKQSKAKKTT